jgi:hypothetical protein
MHCLRIRPLPRRHHTRVDHDRPPFRTERGPMGAHRTPRQPQRRPTSTSLLRPALLDNTGGTFLAPAPFFLPRLFSSRDERRPTKNYTTGVLVNRPRTNTNPVDKIQKFCLHYFASSGTVTLCSLVRDEQTHPHRPRLVVSHSTCPPLSSSPHANSFVIGPAVIKHTLCHARTGSAATFSLYACEIFLPICTRKPSKLSLYFLARLQPSYSLRSAVWP